MSQAKFNFTYLFFCLLIFLMISCSKDETCTPKAFNENIIGNWNIERIDIFGDTTSGTGSFKMDGTFFTFPEVLIVPDDINGLHFTLPKKIYQIIENKISITASNTEGTFSLTNNATMNKNECDKIILDASWGPSTITLSR